MLLKDYADGWLRDSIHLRPGTKDKYQGALRSRILSVFGSRQIEDITRSQVKSWVAQLHGDGLKPATIATLFRTFHTVMEAAVVDEVIAKNPVHNISLPQDENSEASFMTMEEAHALADAIDPRYRVMILLATHTGMRFSEIVALKPSAVDILRAEVRVEQAMTEVSGSVHIHKPKTKRSRRTIKIPREIAEALGIHMGSYSNAEWVFPAPQGGPIRRRLWMKRFWRPAAQKIGLDPEKGFHSLRHGHASTLLEAGVPVGTVSARLGHSKISTTLDVYGHQMPGASDAAVQVLEGLLAQSP